MGLGVGNIFDWIGLGQDGEIVLGLYLGVGGVRKAFLFLKRRHLL